MSPRRHKHGNLGCSHLSQPHVSLNMMKSGGSVVTLHHFILMCCLLLLQSTVPLSLLIVCAVTLCCRSEALYCIILGFLFLFFLTHCRHLIYTHNSVHTGSEPKPKAVPLLLPAHFTLS